jgi:hypothetical protein
VSDKSEGPERRTAGSSERYHPDVRPPFTDGSLVQAPARDDAAQASSVQGTADGLPHRLHPTGPGSGPEENPVPRGRQFPDLFQKALQGSHLADNVTVKYDGDDERNEPRASSTSSGRSNGGSFRTVGAGGRTPVAAGTAGTTFAAPAKRKWRKGR